MSQEMLSVQHSRPSIVKIQLRGFIRRLNGSRFLPEPAAAGIVALPIDCKGHDVLLLDFHTQSENCMAILLMPLPDNDFGSTHRLSEAAKECRALAGHKFWIGVCCPAGRRRERDICQRAYSHCFG
jgi:hypothetical protein